MKLVFIGTGSAFTVGGNYNSNMYFETDEKKRLLIDCGSDARHALNELGLNHMDIGAVYISHLHADHVGGLEWLALSAKFDPHRQNKPILYCSESMKNDLWNILSGGLSTIEDLQANLSTYFELKTIPDDGSFKWEGLEFHLIRTYHQISFHEKMPSFGLMTAVDGIQVLISTDTKFPKDEKELLRQKYQEADIIFHDCETSQTRTGVHAHYDELVTLDPKIKSKMWLYHYQSDPLPDARKDGFRGFVEKGQCFDFNKPKTLMP